MLDDELFKQVQVSWDASEASLNELLLHHVKVVLQARALLYQGLARLGLVGSPLELVEESVHLVDLALEAAKLRLVGVALLDELLCVFVEGSADSVTLVSPHCNELKNKKISFPITQSSEISLYSMKEVCSIIKEFTKKARKIIMKIKTGVPDSDPSS